MIFFFGLGSQVFEGMSRGGIVSLCIFGSLLGGECEVEADVGRFIFLFNQIEAGFPVP